MEHSLCPNCESAELYRSKEVSAGGGYAPNYLPGLGQWYATAKFTLVVCRRCGLTRFFASSDARAKVDEAKGWARMS